MPWFCPSVVPSHVEWVLFLCSLFGKGVGVGGAVLLSGPRRRANPAQATHALSHQPEAHIFTTLDRSQKRWLGVCEDLTELRRPWMKPVSTSGVRVSHVRITIQQLLSGISYLWSGQHAVEYRALVLEFNDLIWVPGLLLTSSLILWNCWTSSSSMSLSVKWTHPGIGAESQWDKECKACNAGCRSFFPSFLLPRCSDLRLVYSSCFVR